MKEFAEFLSHYQYSLRNLKCFQRGQKTRDDLFLICILKEHKFCLGVNLILIPEKSAETIMNWILKIRKFIGDL